MKKKVFLLFNIIPIFVLIVCMILDFIFYNTIDLLSQNNVFDISLPILISVLVMVVTIISISLSLQREKFYGVDYEIFEMIRKKVENFFPFTIICIICISLSILAVVYLILSFYISLITLMIIGFSYSLYFCINEIPVMCRNTCRVNKILTLYFLKYTNTARNQQVSIPEFVSIISNYFFKEKSLTRVYNALKTKDEEKNQQLFLFVLNSIEAKTNELKRSVDTIDIANKYEIICNCIKFKDFLELDIFNNKKNNFFLNYTYIYTRIIFAIKSNKNYDIDMSNLKLVFEDLLLMQGYQTSENIKLCSARIIQDIIINSVLNNDLYFLNILLERFSEDKYTISTNNNTFVMFFNIQMFLMYIINFEIIISDSLKNELKKWIEKPSEIINRNRVLNWKQLSKYFYAPYNGYKGFSQLNEVINYFNLSHWESNINSEAKFVILNTEFIVENYLLYLLITHQVNQLKIEEITSLQEDIQIIIYRVLVKWFNDDKTIKLDYFKKYDNSIIELDNQIFNQQGLKIYLEFKNKQRLQEILIESEKSKNIKNDDFSSDIKNLIESNINKSFGCKGAKVLQKEEKFYYNMLIEKDVTSVNYKEVLAKSFSNGILNVVKQKTKYTEIAFNKIIDKLTTFRKYKIDAMPSYLNYSIKYKIKDNTGKIQAYFNNLNKISCSNNIPNNMIFNQENYGFSYELVEFSSNELTTEELNRIIDENKKPDGQYFFKQAYCNRKQIEELIKDSYFRLKIVFKVKVYNNNKSSRFVLLENDKNNK